MDETLYILIGFPLLAIAATLYAWWEHRSGSSPPGRGELEYLLALKRSIGFARSAARLRPRRWQFTISDAAADWLESLLSIQRREPSDHFEN